MRMRDEDQVKGGQKGLGSPWLRFLRSLGSRVLWRFLDPSRESGQGHGNFNRVRGRRRPTSRRWCDLTSVDWDKVHSTPSVKDLVGIHSLSIPTRKIRELVSGVRGFHLIEVTLTCIGLNLVPSSTLVNRREGDLEGKGGRRGKKGKGRDKECQSRVWVSNLKALFLRICWENQ